MRTLLTLLRKDISIFLRNRAAVSLTFAVPIALIYIFGQVFGLNRHGKSSGPENIALGVVVESTDPAAQTLVDALKAEKTFKVVREFTPPNGSPHPLTEAEARQLIRDHAFNFALVIPSDLLPDDKIGIRLKILSNPRNDIETQTVNGLLQKTIFSNVPELLGESLQKRAIKFVGSERVRAFNRDIATAVARTYGGDADKIQQRLDSADYGFGQFSRRKATPPDPTLRRLDNRPEAKTSADAPATSAKSPAAGAGPAAAGTRPDVFSNLIHIETDQVEGKEVKSPAATRVIGGYAIMFLLFAISGSSAAFFDEKNTGIFQRILSAPVSRVQLITARFLFGVLLGLVQLVALFGAGSMMYGVDVLGHLGNLVIACTVAAAACTSFGMLIAAWAPNAQAANGLATFVVMVMSATGGAWFPISLMPEFMQRIGKLTIVYWSMESFSGVLWAGDSLRDLLPTLGVLLGITIGVMALAVWRLNRKPILE